MSSDAPVPAEDEPAREWGALRRALDHAIAFRDGLPTRPVGSRDTVDDLRATFSLPLHDHGRSPTSVVDELVALAEPGLVATAGPRFFGFVIGGAFEAATAADVLAAGWDQCAFNAALSRAAMGAEHAAGAWLKDLLGVPTSASVGFVTGAQEANTVGLAAGRHAVLRDAGWDLERDGLAGAPRLRVVASAERHATVDRSLRLLGIGTAAIDEVAAAADGAIDVGDLHRVLAQGPAGPTVVCLQAGNVNTGACDDLRAACALADSWGCDGHKWLNVPYDAAYAFCAHPDATPRPRPTRRPT